MPGRKCRENAPNAACSPAGVSTPTCLRKSAHSASHADTGGGCVLVGSVPLHHEFFNALLLSCKVYSLKLLLIKLLDD